MTNSRHDLPIAPKQAWVRSTLHYIRPIQFEQDWTNAVQEMAA
jgi:hypothetical protein